MFTFLRKVRRSLIESDSHPGSPSPTLRYMLYALGEILLVMVGILLALQVNTWNNNRINRNLEKQYLNRMIQDLKADIEDVEAASNSALRRIAIGVHLMDTLGAERNEDWDDYNNGSLNYSDFEFPLPATFGEMLVQLRFFRVFNGVDITMQELLSNGKLDVIRNDEIKIAIQSHYSQIDIRKFFSDLVRKARNDYVEELTTLGIGAYNADNYESLRIRIANKNRLMAHIENIMSLANGVILDYESDEGSIKKSTEKLINEIENYLDKIN